MSNATPAQPTLDVTAESLVSGLLGLEFARQADELGKTLETDSLKLTDEERRKRFGRRLKLMRQARGLKQADLAAILETPPQVISVWEVGKQEPSLKNLIALSRALNVSADWLLGEKL